MRTLDGVKLVDCRRRQALTQAQLAYRANVAPATISNLERGLHAPRLSVIRKIADVLKVDPAEIDEFKPALGLSD